ncbi:MAG TPA: tetratricopeptide repeat protein [Caldimonas sp.]|jgi:tetratricopeptide (TPR) repeat protein|nr:tetratricopeptide repeat protein [Caldimonas sp.]HEX2542389.1 tetratricopeptide repeat protein [Caldimonas sp.]
MPVTPRAWDYAWLKLCAMALLVLGRRSAAEAVFDRLLSRFPDDAYALASRAHLRAEGGQTMPAVEDAQRLVDLHPGRRAADWFNLGFLRDRLGEHEAAEAAFRQALVLEPKLDRAWYGLALTFIQQGRLDDAVAALKKNTELQPLSPFGWYQLARVHANRHEAEKARRIIAHLKNFEPKVAAQLERETGLAA